MQSASNSGAGSNTSADQIDLAEIVRAVSGSRWHMAAITLMITALSVAYALMATPWYRAEVVLLPAEESNAPAFGSQLGGLASLAGLDMGAADSTEPVAVLTSRQFTGDFVEEGDLMPILFASEWDAETETWKSSSPDKHPDIRDGISYFDRKVRSVSQDNTTGVLTVRVEWKDPEKAAAWANTLVDKLNQRMRAHALLEAERNIEYLKSEIAATTLVTLQQSISTLLESQYQNLMLARGNEQFAFRVIDRATVPKYRSWPNRKLIVALGAVVGLIAGFGFAVFRHSRLRDEAH